jgi:lysophospholipase L1-like esterase
MPRSTPRGTSIVVRIARLVAFATIVTSAAAGVAEASTSTTSPVVGGTLADARDAVAAAGAAPVDVLFVGDSITEGYGAPSRSDWWVELARTELQEGRGGGVGYVPTSFSGGAAAPFPGVWRAEGGRAVQSSGLGLRSYLLDAQTASLRATLSGTRLEVRFTAAPGRGTAEIRIDGTVVATVDTHADTERGGLVWTSDQLRAGDHAIEIRQAAATREPGPIVVEGAAAFDGEAGIRIWDGSHAGFAASSFVGERAWLDGVDRIDPEVVVLALGTNDFAFGADPQRFAADLATIVDEIAARSTGRPAFVLMPMWRGTGRDAARYERLVQAQRDLVTNRGYGLVDLSDIDAGLVTDDGIHPNADGQRVIARAVLSALDGSYVAPAAPEAPAGLTATAAADGSITATWQSVPGATAYAVRAVDGAHAVVASQRATGTTTTVTGLPTGQHRIEVLAVSAAGFSPPTSSEVVAVVAPLRPPADPTTVVAAPGAAAGSATITWAPPAGQVTDYLLIAYDAAAGFVGHQTTTTTSATFALTAGRSYVFGVYAHNAAGYSVGVASNFVTLPVPLAPTLRAPEAPTGVVGTAGTSPGTATVTWTAPAGATAHSVRAIDASTGAETGSAVVVDSAATVSGLTPGRSYRFSVTASNAAGTSAAATSATVSLPLPLPAAPTNVTAAVGTASGTARVTWTAPAGPVDGYLVLAFDSASGYVGSRAVETTTATFDGLTPGRTYAFTVHARNATGHSAGAASGSITLPAPVAPTPPPAPTSVSASRAGAGTLTVRWTAPSGTVTGYLVQVYDVANGFVKQVIVTQPSATIGGLAAGRSYQVAVWASNVAGYSSPSASNVVRL